MKTDIEKLYSIKYIKTKSKIRKIVTYKDSNSEIRRYHQSVVDFLKANTKDSIFAKAYRKNTSIYDNAEAHLYNDYFVILDINNFFQSLNHEYLAKTLYHEIRKKTEISFFECCDIVRKCSVNDIGLPLGLVSSPTLANLYLKEFDGRLYSWLKKQNIENPIYTRYADDIVISYRLSENISFNMEKIVAYVSDLLKIYHLNLNNKKTKKVNLQLSGHVRITGISIVVNKSNNYRHISVGKKEKNKLFWKAIELYDHREENYLDILKLKGTWSYIMSIEKNGIDNSYSDNMIKLLKERGFSNLSDLIKSL